MSQTVRTSALRRPGRAILPDGVDTSADTGLGASLLLSPAEILERVWRVFTSMRTGLVLMLALAALALVGTVLIQAPPGLKSDASEYRSWLDSVRPKYGGWTGVLDTLQLFGVFTSVWFKGIVVALVTSILACSVNRFRGLWKTSVRPRTRMTGTFYRRAPYSATIAAPLAGDDALDGLRRVLRARHFRAVVERDDEGVHVYADRFRWTPFGTFIGHISLVLILVGALVGATFGFRSDEFAVPVGSTVDVGNGTGLAVEARSFHDSYYENGAPSDYASDLVVYRAGSPVARQTIRVNQPLEVDGVKFFQSFFGAAAVLKVTDASGATVSESGVPLLWGTDEGRRRIGRLFLEDAGLTVFVVGAASGEVDPEIRPGQMQLEVYRTGGEDRPIAVQLVSQGEPARIADLDFTFVREREFTGLIVARDPGIPLVWLGAMLLVVGVCLVFFFPNRRVWARVRPTGPASSEIVVGATSRHDATFGPDFQRLVDDMRLALSGTSAA